MEIEERMTLRVGRVSSQQVLRILFSHLRKVAGARLGQVAEIRLLPRIR